MTREVRIGVGIIGAGFARSTQVPVFRACPGVGFLLFARQVVRALREGMTLVEGAATFEDGWRNQLVLDATRRSHAERRWVVP